MRKKSEKLFRELQRRFAENLTRLRAAQGLTQEQLGQRTGLHWRHLQKMEAGESNVTMVTMARLADGLGVDARDLMAGAR